MKRAAILALTGILGLSACGGSGSISTLPSQLSNRTASSVNLAPYQMPIVTDPAVQAAERAYKSTLRNPKTSYGGVPTAICLTDAPNFGPGAQVNLAIVAVNARSAGTAYSVVQYSTPLVVNVLNYMTTSLSLGTFTLPALAYDGVEYVVDASKSSVVANGVTYPVVFGQFASRTFTASGNNLGTFYFPSVADGSTGKPLNFLMEFSASHWISLHNGIAEVAPRGGATVTERAAVIIGKVVNFAGAAVSGATVAAIDSSGKRVRLTRSNTDGSFELHAIDGGTYSVAVYNTYAPDDSDETIFATGNDPGDSVVVPGVAVPAGYRIDLGLISD
ncbi:MAG: hypothetical protein NVS2B17_25440 [Candidatus Velthaea sp.]